MRIENLELVFWFFMDSLFLVSHHAVALPTMLPYPGHDQHAKNTSGDKECCSYVYHILMVEAMQRGNTTLG